MVLPLIVALTLATQTTPVPPVPVAQFAAADLAARRQMMRSAFFNPDQFGADVLPLIETGLQDSDSQVRFSASSALSQLIMRGPNGFPNPRTRPSLVPVLVRLLDDPDHRIGAGAAHDLAFFGALAGRNVRAKIVEMYDREQYARSRPGFIDVLRPYAQDSPEIQALMIRALDDESPDVRRRAAVGVATFRPTAALPRIVAELQSGNEETRSDFVYALASYGVKAKPHVRLLETFLAAETNSARGREIQQAITTIRESR